MQDLEYLRLLEAAVEHSFDAVVITTARLDRPGPEIVYANPAFCRMAGYSEDELIGRSPRILQGPRTSRALLDRLREALEDGQPFSARTVNYRKDGTPYDVEWSISPVRGPDGSVTHYVSVQRDVTAETRERVRREMLVYALDETSDNVVITDRDVRILDVNKAFENHTGFVRDEVRGENPRILQSGMHDRVFYRRMWDTLGNGDVFRATFTDRKKNGRLVHLEETITPVKDENGRISGYVSIGKDVSERVRAENELMRLATTDMLTGLTNRMHFEKILREEIERSTRYDHPLSLIMMDIDSFKRINDRHGHAAGDEVLTHFARLLSANVRTPDTFARWGGEKFMLLTPETDVDQAMTMADNLRQTVREETFPAVGTVTCSFGVVGVDTEKGPEEAIRQADKRLYRAKGLGRDRVVAGVPVATSRHRNAEHGRLARPRRARLEPGICCVVVLGKGITLPRRTSALHLPGSRRAERYRIRADLP